MGQRNMENINPPASLKKRYLAKLSTNVIGLLINVVIQAIVPRGLGPSAYGDFSFLSNFFTRVVGFLNMGTSTCFYTKLSQRQDDYKLVSFYSLVTLVVVLILLVGTWGVGMTNYYSAIWPGQKGMFVFLAALWGGLTWIVQVLNKAVDAFGVTLAGEVAKICQKVFGLGIILTLYLMGKLSLSAYFGYHFIILIFISTAFIWVMREYLFRSLKNRWRLSCSDLSKYTKEFYYYSRPLFIYSLVGLCVGVFDRWFLQYFSGSIEQGFFGLSYQIGAICFLFSSAMTPLITREFSIAFGKQDIPEMASLFRRYIPMLYGIAAFFACFIVVEADKVSYFLGGDKFMSASGAVAIMAFYPIHQTYGQLSGAVFYATGQTGLYRNIGVFFMLAGLPATWILLAPLENLGLELGAVGLAIKIVIFQFLTVNVQLYFNARFLKLPFAKYFIHQVCCVLIFLILAYLARELIKFTPYVNRNVFIRFCSSGFFYVLLVASSVQVFPYIMGASRKDIDKLQMGIQSKLLKK